eukprot:TRINITY_DN72078_c0_g1_i1.p1 TRINITY_DN72078_c0_g1~~TRINITY_DN72078_c0_g1_i1.p1  ORF type:complete len:437 (-),score=89.88 TRINITY_DN72078_c0_g1_i1:194-1504(-)
MASSVLIPKEVREELGLPQGKLGEVKRRDSIRKVKFGNSDMMVSELCVGTMTWGSFISDEKEAWAELDAAFDAGANFIDTAELYPVAFNYGKTTEQWCGNWFKERLSQGKFKREEVYIATKSNPSQIGGQKEGEAPKPHSYETDILEQSCRMSLDRLQCDYIDLYQLHWPSRDTPVFGCSSFHPGKNKNRPMPFVDEIPAGQLGTDVFERQVLSVKNLLDKGLIKYWGLSNENAYGITMFCVTCDRLGVPRPVSCQNQFSMLDRVYEGDTWEAAYRCGVVGLPYGVLSGGVLSGKYFDDTKYAEEANADRPLEKCRMRSNPGFQPKYGMPMCMEATRKYVALAEAYGITPTELALAWALQRPCNTCIITGTCTVKQMEQCISGLKMDLPEDLMAAVDCIHEEIRNPACHMNHKSICMDAPWLGDQACVASKKNKIA